MNNKERISIAIILLFIAFLTTVDLLTDAQVGVAWWHIALEALVALVAIVSVFVLLKGTFKLKHSLEDQKKISAKLEEDSKKWREQSRKYLDGLSHSIDNQLTSWELTTSEKEVAFLLLKGFSLKEIADIRQTTEKTSRAQSTAIYAKAGLTGRSQLSAFFLEDLLMPDQKEG